MRKFIKIDFEELAPNGALISKGEALIDIEKIVSIRQYFTKSTTETIIHLDDGERIRIIEPLQVLWERIVERYIIYKNEK